MFLYAWEVELEGVVDFATAGDNVEVALTKTDPGTTMVHMNDSQVIDKVFFSASAATGYIDQIPKKTFIRPVILSGEKIYGIIDSNGLGAALSANFRLHYQLKWVNAQVFNRSLLTNV